MFLCPLWLAKPLGRLRSNLQNFKHKESGINIKLKKFTKKKLINLINSQSSPLNVELSSFTSNNKELLIKALIKLFIIECVFHTLHCIELR